MHIYPTITNIKQVLPLIADKEDFRHNIDKNYGFQNILYRTFNPHETFPVIKTEDDKILRECRGISFDLFGNIIARPFHKFFNLEERNETRDIELTQDNHIVMEKIDGSLVFPVPTENSCFGYVMCTKAGKTDIGDMALDFILSNGYGEYIKKFVEKGLTPLFEFCSKKNRVVINYDTTRLYLLGAREIKSGRYLTKEEIVNVAGVPPMELAAEHGAFTKNMVNTLRYQYDREGIVIFNTENQQMYKVKTDWYLNLHKAVDSLRNEKNVLEIILNDDLDDLLPVLQDKDRDKILCYANQIRENINRNIATIKEMCEFCKKNFNSRKEVAFHIKDNLPNHLSSFFWAEWDGKDTHSRIISHMKMKTGSQSHVDDIRELIGTEYSY